MNQEYIKEDINLIELMLINIKKFFEKKMHIFIVADNLEAYVNHLNIEDERFESAFFKIWEDIEIILALTLAENLEELTQEDSSKVETLLYSLQEIVSIKLKEMKTLLIEEDSDGV